MPATIRIEGYHKDEAFDLENHYLADGAVLQDCRLVIRVPRFVSIGGVRLTGCNIVSPRWATSMVWCAATLERCRFTGKYRGNDFGGWPEAYQPVGSIVECDFTRAELDGCRIFADTPNVVRLPGWPHFSLLHPSENGRRIHEHPRVDGRIKLILEMGEPPEVAAVVLNAKHSRSLKTIGEAKLRRELAELGGMIQVEVDPILRTISGEA